MKNKMKCKDNRTWRRSCETGVGKRRWMRMSRFVVVIDKTPNKNPKDLKSKFFSNFPMFSINVLSQGYLNIEHF